MRRPVAFALIRPEDGVGQWSPCRFIAHPLEVASLLERSDYYPDHVVAAAILHDALEDTDAEHGLPDKDAETKLTRYRKSLAMLDESVPGSRLVELLRFRDRGAGRGAARARRLSVSRGAASEIVRARRAILADCAIRMAADVQEYLLSDRLEPAAFGEALGPSLAARAEPPASGAQSYYDTFDGRLYRAGISLYTTQAGSPPWTPGCRSWRRPRPTTRGRRCLRRLCPTGACAI